MRQNVKISGMTCQACVSSVTEKLISLDEVQDLKIDLAEGDVVLEVSKTLTLEKLNFVLVVMNMKLLNLKKLKQILKKILIRKHQLKTKPLSFIKENIYSDIDEMLNSTLNTDDEKK